MCNNIKKFFRWFRKVLKMNIAFGFWQLLKFFLFEWRFADWPWNVVILLGFQVPAPYFDLIFGICDTCRCEITWTIISGSSLVFTFFREKHCVLFLVPRILCCSWLHALEQMRQAQEKDGNSGHLTGKQPAATEIQHWLDSTTTRLHCHYIGISELR